MKLQKIVGYLRLAVKFVMLLAVGLMGGAIGMAFTEANDAAFNHYMPVGSRANNISGGTVASAATIVPAGYQTFVSGTTGVDNIQVPWDGFEGTIALIPTGIFSISTSGNVAIGVTTVVSKVLFLTYSQKTSKWYPSYLT